MKALSVESFLRMKKETLPFEGAWKDAFGEPERYGVWFVWGRSGNGKTSFVMQLCKELCKYGTVAYDSLEEGSSLTMQNTVRRFGMLEVRGRFVLLDCEGMDDLSRRLDKPKSADFVVIDSFQYSQLDYKKYIAMKERHCRRKLLIFVSHASGMLPSSKPASSVMYDATLKIWVEGYKAFSKGRFIGRTGEYTIWEEQARKYWGYGPSAADAPDTVANGKEVGDERM